MLSRSLTLLVEQHWPCEESPISTFRSISKKRRPMRVPNETLPAMRQKSTRAGPGFHPTTILERRRVYSMQVERLLSWPDKEPYWQRTNLRRQQSALMHR